MLRCEGPTRLNVRTLHLAAVDESPVRFRLEDERVAADGVEAHLIGAEPASVPSNVNVMYDCAW